MPKKPIKPDRVRTPREWWNAKILLALSIAFAGGVTGVGGFALWEAKGISVPLWVWLVVVVVVGVPSVVNVRRVRRKWSKHIEDNGGLLCPNCAYVVKGSKEEGNGVRCAECGYFIEDWKGLHERWLKKLKWFG